MIKIPRGEMCLGCKDLMAKCNHLPFEKMKPISKPDKEGYVEVRCINYERLEDEDER